MLSEDKVSHLSHILLRSFLAQSLMEALEDEATIRREIKRVILTEMKIGEEIDQIVRKKLQSLSKKMVEGSPEWEITYKRYFREEEIKRGRASG